MPEPDNGPSDPLEARVLRLIEERNELRGTVHRLRAALDRAHAQLNVGDHHTTATWADREALNAGERLPDA